MPYSSVIANWKRTAKAIEDIGGEVSDFYITQPATKEEVLQLEKKLRFPLPHSLKEVLLNFSKKVDFRWDFPQNYVLEDDFFDIFSGEISWSLDTLYDLNEDKKGWVKEVFSDEDDPYDITWHNTLAFHGITNGDFLVIDLSTPDKEAVVYLSHDDGEGHGFELAATFKEFLFLSSPLGNVGAEDWQWLPFTEKGQPYLLPDCENAKLFRAALNITEFS